MCIVVRRTKTITGKDVVDYFDFLTGHWLCRIFYINKVAYLKAAGEEHNFSLDI